MENKQTNLKRLMDILDISGNEMSEALNIDVTTISKLRNGQRRLTSRSKYLHPIAVYLYHSKVSQKRDIVERILKDAYPNQLSADEEQMIGLLCIWLTDETLLTETVSDGKSENVQIFNGPNGLYESVKKFWSQTIATYKNKEIMWIDYGDIDYEANPELLSVCLEYIGLTIKRGNTIVLVDSYPDEINPFLGLFRWLPVFLTGKVKIMCRHFRDRRDSRYSIFSVPGECALFTMGMDKLPDTHHCVLHNDAESVDFFYNTSRSEMEGAHQMIECIPISGINAIMHEISRKLKVMQPVYYLLPAIEYSSMSPDLMRKVLKENDVDGETAECCLNSLSFVKMMVEKYSIKKIYDLDSIEECAQLPSHIDGELSRLCGKPIHISREIMREHLLLLSDSAENIVFAPFKYFDKIPKHTSVIVQDISLVSCWDAEHYGAALICDQAHINEGFNSYLERLINSMPKICQKTDWIRRKISILTNNMA